MTGANCDVRREEKETANKAWNEPCHFCYLRAKKIPPLIRSGIREEIRENYCFTNFTVSLLLAEESVRK